MKPLPPVRSTRFRWSSYWRRSYTFVRVYPNDKRLWACWDEGKAPFYP